MSQPDFGKYLRIVRESKGLNQSRLTFHAFKVGAQIGFGTISRLELGERKPSREMVEKIVTALQPIDDRTIGLLFIAAGFTAPPPNDTEEIMLKLRSELREILNSSK